MDFLSVQASLKPTRDALIDLTLERRWDFAALDYVVGQWVSWFNQRGLQAGDRLACIAKNRAELVMMHLACGRTGVIYVPLNWRLSTEEIQLLLADCEPALVLGDSIAASLGVDHEPLDGVLAQVEALGSMPVTDTSYRLPSLILYTSGTTGKPKGIMHSEASLMETTLNMCVLGQVNEDSVFLCETPMFHVIGLVSCVRPALYCGGHILISDGFNPERTLGYLMDPVLRISHYFCVPQMADSLRHHPSYNPARLRNLKGLLTGGAPHPAVQIRAWLRDGIPIVDGYGMSEAGTIFGMPFDVNLIDNNAGCVGLATQRVKVRLADDNNQPVKQGQPGEVQLKGDNLFVGIWQQPLLFDKCFTSDGWFKTGDVAVMNGTGFYRIVDRQKDMFISGGENVYPVEIEGVVLGIQGVRECAVVGVPDERWGEVGCLYVVPHAEGSLPAETELLTQIGEHLAKFKIPKHVRVIDALPRNGAGKVVKPQLREQFSA